MNDLLLKVVNAITLADELLALELQSSKTPPPIDVRLLKGELEHVLRVSRIVAGVTPMKPHNGAPRPSTKRGSR